MLKVTEAEGGLRDDTYAGQKSLLMTPSPQISPRLKGSEKKSPQYLIFVPGVGDESSALPFLK